MRILKKIVALTLFVLLILSLYSQGIVGNVVNADETENEIIENDVNDIDSSENSEEGAISKYCGDGFIVEIVIENEWNEGFNTKVSIENISDETIENWCIAFPFDNSIISI